MDSDSERSKGNAPDGNAGGGSWAPFALICVLAALRWAVYSKGRTAMSLRRWFSTQVCLTITSVGTANTHAHMHADAQVKLVSGLVVWSDWTDCTMNQMSRLWTRSIASFTTHTHYWHAGRASPIVTNQRDG